MTEPARSISFGGPVNFRDLGGYLAADGRRVGWRKLFRSDSLHTATAADAVVLREIGVRTAIDFRSRDEVEHLGIGPLDSIEIRYLNHPTFDRLVDAPAFHGKTAGDFVTHMLERGAGAYVAAAETLVESGSLPAVFFCYAGKDRTGCFAALLLGLLGVSDDDIVSDYCMTQAVLPILHARARGSGSPGVRIPPAHELPPGLDDGESHVIEGLVDQVRRRWGGWEGFAIAVGMHRDGITRLRDVILERT